MAVMRPSLPLMLVCGALTGPCWGGIPALSVGKLWILLVPFLFLSLVLV